MPAAQPTMRGNWRVYHHASIDSTNLEALRLAGREALPWTAVLADTQTAGRGRLGRTWTDLPGRCVLLTALAFPPPGAEPLLAPAMAVSAVLALERIGAREVAIKWPNDVLIRGRKVAGVLAEGPTNGLVAVGIGLNANAGADDIPEDIRGRATFASVELGHELDRLRFADSVLSHFEHQHHRLMAGERAEIVAALREHDCLAGRAIRARSGADLIEGRAKGWTDDGRLAIIDGDGHEIALDAGEVTLS
ncbi:MAG: biotin--[acetyl-CoA-carboxylase] ligase [Armatimonadota bacterium]